MMKHREFSFGQGKISGVISVFLSVLCLLGVLCFRYPEILTTPELRQIYPVDLLRDVLAFCLLAAFTMGITSYVLSQNKTLSLIGVAITSLAIVMGGAWVETPEEVKKSNYIGLDWFVLDLLVVALIFIPLERIFARLKDQKIFRTGWKTDLAYFFVNHVLIQISSFLIMTPSLTLSSLWTPEGIRGFISSQHIIIQFLEILIIADLTQYWAHRLFHKVPYLWKFHAVHHSSQEMDWLAGSRLHLVDIIITRALTLLPIFILGFSQAALNGYLVFVAFLATFIHANVKFKFKWLHKILATPMFHHWHHAAASEAIDKNFAVHLPIIDLVFGTYHLPKDKWPDSYGISSK